MYGSLLKSAFRTRLFISLSLSGADLAVALIIVEVCMSVSFLMHRCPGTMLHTSRGRYVCLCSWPTCIMSRSYYCPYNSIELHHTRISFAVYFPFQHHSVSLLFLSYSGLYHTTRRCHSLTQTNLPNIQLGYTRITSDFSCHHQITYVKFRLKPKSTLNTSKKFINNTCL